MEMLWFPHQVLFSENNSGENKGFPLRRYKDQLKITMKATELDSKSLKTQAQDCNN